MTRNFDSGVYFAVIAAVNSDHQVTNILTQLIKLEMIQEERIHTQYTSGYSFLSYIYISMLNCTCTSGFLWQFDNGPWCPIVYTTMYRPWGQVLYIFLYLVLGILLISECIYFVISNDTILLLGTNT